MKLLKFSASWCGPCKQLQSYIDNNPREFPIPIEHIDVDVAKELCKEFNVRSVPTCILVGDDYKEYGRVSGFKPDDLKDLFGID